MREVFDLLARIQKKRNIDLLIIGGWAHQAYGDDHFTADVDCLTTMEQDAFVGEELAGAGFACSAENPVWRRYMHRCDPLLVLDVMRVDASAFAGMATSAHESDFFGNRLRVPARARLLALNLRELDFPPPVLTSDQYARWLESIHAWMKQTGTLADIIANRPRPVEEIFVLK